MGAPPPPAGPCDEKVDSWWGDNYCDDFMNTEGCEYDGGDCCQENPAAGWDNYCSENSSQVRWTMTMEDFLGYSYYWQSNIHEQDQSLRIEVEARSRQTICWWRNPRDQEPVHGDHLILEL